MIKLLLKSIIFVIFVSLYGCGFGEFRSNIYNDFNYKKPTHSNIGAHVITLNQPYDKVWKNLIQYSGSTFFAIDNLPL